MKHEFSLAHLTILGCSPPDLIEVAAEAGYDYVSLRPIAVTPNEPKYPLGEDKSLLQQTKNALAATGMRVLDIEVARILPGLNPRTYMPAFEAAAELGARHVLTNGCTPDRHYVGERFAELCDLAKPLGLTVDLEFVTFAAISTLAEAAAVVYSAGRDNGGICVDTLHFYRSNTELTELDALPRSWFRFMQLCDAPIQPPSTIEGLTFSARADRKFLGEGALDLASVIRRLPPMPYSLEIPNTKLARSMSPRDIAKKAIETARSYLDKMYSNSSNKYGINSCSSQSSVM
jgi:sugar phosphate isomerase/epimerase